MQPQSPNKDFDFMLKDQPKAGQSWVPNLSSPLKIALAALAGLILIIVIASLISGHKNSGSQAFVGVLARANETLRVTTLVQQQLNLQDPQTQALAATVSTAIASDKQQISAYLAKNHVRVPAAQLSADTDKSADASLQAASQNNGLDVAYVSYLKTALAKYQSDLQTAYKTAGSNGQKLLAGSFESTRTLLNSSPIKS